MFKPHRSPALSLLLLLAVLIMSSHASTPTYAAGTIYVSRTATGANNGTSWINAYTTLQDAIAAAVSGDKIWVAAGTYYPDEGVGQTNNNRTASFTLKDGVAIYGGFAGTETLLSERNATTNIVILSGDIGQDDTTSPITNPTNQIQGSNSYQVVKSNGVSSSAILDGVTITAGHADGVYPNNSGGGIANSYSSAVFTSVTIIGNHGEYGGGVYNDFGGSVFTNVVISSNIASYAGGIFNYDSDTSFIGVSITNNGAANRAGGMYSYSGNISFNGGIISGNITGGDGAGVYNAYSNGKITSFTNVTINNNTACTFPQNLTCYVDVGSKHGGGGVYNYYSDVSFTNVTIKENAVAKGYEVWTLGGGVYNYYSDAVFTNVAIERNTANSGAGFVNEHGNPVIIGSGIKNNKAGWGSGFYNIYGKPIFINVAITDNSSTEYGGGIHVDYGDLTLTNVTIAGNSSGTPDAGGGWLAGGVLSGLDLRNSIVWGNKTISNTVTTDSSIGGSGTFAYAHSLIQGSKPAGTGNLDGTLSSNDPLFTAPASGDYSLKPGSPAINVGANTFIPAGITTDALGKPRIMGGTVDLGAYETEVFEVQRNGFNFANYGYPEGGASWEQFKKTFPGTQMELPSGERRLGPELYFNDSIYQDVGAIGNCVGFSTISMIRFLKLAETVELDILSPDNRAISLVHDLPASTDVKDYIYLYQARQYSWERWQWENGVWENAPDDGTYHLTGGHNNDTPIQTYEAVRDRTQAGVPVEVEVKGYGYAHSMLAYRTDQEGNIGYVYVYDNDFPNDDTSRIEINLTTGWWSYRYGWGGAGGLIYYPASLNTSPHIKTGSDYDATTAVAGTTNQGTTLLIDGAGSLLITDSQGRQMGYKAGNLTLDIPNASPIYNVGYNADNPDANPIIGFYLPPTETFSVTIQPSSTGTYTITAFGDGSGMRLADISITAGFPDHLVLEQSVLRSTFEPATDHTYCQYLTREVSATASRSFNSCVTDSVSKAVRFTLDPTGNALTVENKGSSAVALTSTINQVGTGANTTVVSKPIAPGTSVTISTGRSMVYLPLTIR